MYSIGGKLSMITPRQLLVGCAITIFLVFLAWLSIWPGTPKIYAPFNCLVILPRFWMDYMLHPIGSFLSIAIVPTVFWMWCLPVLCGCVTIPTRSIILLVCAIGMSTLSLAFGWQSGIQYQGLGYVIGVIAINSIMWVVLGALALVAWRYPSAVSNLTFHAAFFAWLAWYAFPYFGELP